MHKSLGVLGWFCLLACPVLLSAQSVPPKLRCEDPASTMLWQVQGRGLEAGKVGVQLLGSIHVGQPEFYPLPQVVEKYFNTADTLVFEIDPRSSSTPQAAAHIQQLGTLPDSKTLAKVVDAATMSSLRTVLKQLQMPMASVSHMKPWMVTIVLAAVQVQAMGYNPAYGVENYLMEHRPPAARIAELETFDSQLAMLEAFDQQTLLHYTLQDFSATSPQLQNMVTAWRCGDHAVLSEILFAAKTEEEARLDRQQQAALDRLMQQLFDERNKVMADKIEQFIKTGSGDYFVVVGAGHLLGDNSVIRQLQQKGFTVTPVRNQP